MIRNADNLRSLVLTVLLVVSAVAGMSTGSVAQAGNAPGEPPSVDKATHYADTAGNPVLEIAFTEDIDTSSVNASTEIAVTLDNGTTLTVYDGGYQNGFATRTLEPGRLVVDTGGTTYNTVSNVTVEGVQDTGGTALDRQTVDVRYASTTVDTDGSTQEVDVYRGANVSLVRGTNVGTTFDIEGQDNLTYDVTRGSGPNSEVYVWETEGRTPGTYNVSDGTDEVPVTVQSLGLTASVDEPSFETDESVTGTIEANGIDRDVTVELLDERGDVEATRTVQIGSDGSADFAFDHDETGNCTVEARDVDTGITASSAAFTVTDSGTATAGFGSATYTEARGDVVNLTITVADTDTATVQIGDHETASYNVTAEVVDEDGDGTVDLTFNTFEAGHGGATPDDVVAVEGEDSLAEVQQGGSFTTTYPGDPGADLLEAGEYDLQVEAGSMDGTTVTDADDVATLSLVERETENLTIWTAPGDDFGSFGDAADVAEFRSEDALVQRDTIADGDTMVVAIRANGIEGTFEDTEDFQRVVRERRLFILTYETADGPNDPTEAHNVSELDADDITVISNDTDGTALDTYYVVVDSGEVTDLFEDHESGDSYDVMFNVHGDDDDNDLGENHVSVNDSVGIEDPTVTLDTNSDDEILLGPDGGTITGETNRAPDTDFMLRVRSDGAAEPFFLTVPATVQSDGTFQATVNLSGAVRGDNFTVQPRLDGEDVGESYSGYIAASSAVPPATETTGTAATASGTADGRTTTELTPLDTQTPTDTAVETTTGEDGAGFTAVGAVLALLAAAAFAVRRGD